jgi:hypothetical protein
MEKLSILILIIICGLVTAFQAGVGKFRALGVVRSGLELHAKSEKDDKSEDVKLKFGLKDLMKLVSMGAGAPTLGEYKYSDSSGRMFFELEGNNLVDSEGNSVQMKATYFEKGYTEDMDDSIAGSPGFFENLLSGGTKMQKWQQEAEKKGKFATKRR